MTQTDIGEVVPVVLSEQEYIAWRRETGSKIIEAHGAYWWESFPGFYQNVHFLAAMRADQAKRPTPFCWGYRTAISEKDRAYANASWPICMLRQVQDYDESMLPRTERQQLKKCRKVATIVRLTDADLLKEQGYEVYVSSVRRVGGKTTVSRERYLAKVEKWVRDPRRLVLAGLVDGRLAGYCDCFAVGHCCYLWQLVVATEYLNTGLSTTLTFEPVQLYRRTGLVDCVVNGFDWPERPSLMKYKMRLGFEVVHVPTKLALPFPVRFALRRLRPYAYYRLTGKSVTRRGSVSQ